MSKVNVHSRSKTSNALRNVNFYRNDLRLTHRPLSCLKVQYKWRTGGDMPRRRRSYATVAV